MPVSSADIEGIYQSGSNDIHTVTSACHMVSNARKDRTQVELVAVSLALIHRPLNLPVERVHEVVLDYGFGAEVASLAQSIALLFERRSVYASDQALALCEFLKKAEKGETSASRGITSYW